jgi:hypothetical protein
MRSYLLFAAILVCCTSSTMSSAQSPTSKAENSPAETPIRSLRPKLPLQDALKIAESYIRNKNIDVSKYWLYRANFILYGEEGKGQPAWHFWWIHDGGALGNYVEIVVFMDGQAIRTPSM